MDRKNCSHVVGEHVVLLISWCTRCSGWRFKRVGVDCGLSSDTASTQVYESHFLEQEATDPYDLQVLMMRAFRSAQEWEQDRTEQLDFDSLL